MRIAPRTRHGRIVATCLAATCAVLFALLPAAAAGEDPGPDDSRLEGVIVNVFGEPVPGCRVVARDAAGAEVFVSSPSDGTGHYALLIPRGREYVVVALVSPTGGRVALPDERPLAAQGSIVTRDLLVPMPVAPRPRKALKHLGGVDRFFLAFVEDAALVARQHYEFNFDGADFDAGSRRSITGLAAYQFASLPRMEFGLRGGAAERILDNAPDSDLRGLDLELWSKIHLHRTTNNRYDFVLGGLFTLPTGDPDAGLSSDALQSKLFVGSTYTVHAAVMMAHIGVRVSGDGERLFAPLEGRTSLEGGAGVLIPMSDLTSLVMEASWSDRRFEETEEQGELLVGVNWRPSVRGMARFALAAGLTDSSPDFRVIAGYAITF